MKYTKEILADKRAKLTIKMTAEEWNEALQKAYEKTKGKYRVTRYADDFVIFADSEVHTLEILPEVGVRLRDDVRIIDSDRLLEGYRCKSQSHAMVFVCVDGCISSCRTAGSIPRQLTVATVLQYIAQFQHLRLQCRYAIGLLDLQGRQS